MGQRMLDRRVLKIGSKRSKDQQWQGTFFGGEGNIPQPAGAFCLTSHSHPTYREAGGGRLVSAVFCPEVLTAFK